MAATRVLETILTLPTPIPFTPDAMGRTYQTRFMGRPATISLPRIRWEPTTAQFLTLPPRMRSVKPDVDWAGYLDAWHPWGSVTIWQTTPQPKPRLARVTHMLATVPIAKRWSNDRVSVYAAELASSSYPWWLRLREWIEVATPYLIETFEHPDSRALISNTRVWSWDGQRSRRVPVSQMMYLDGDAEPGIGRRSFAAVAALAGKGTQVPKPHVFLRNARLALRRNDLRAAVLEAATAAELALQELLDARLGGADNEVAGAIRQGNRELGRLTKLLGHLEVSLPSGLQTGLVDVRNRAIHRGDEPTEEQASEAVRLARAVVELAEPSRLLLAPTD